MDVPEQRSGSSPLAHPHRGEDVAEPDRTLTVSVALCTHNGARFVGEQVRSILGQTHPVTEIVLSDDASTDATVAIVRTALDEHSAFGKPSAAGRPTPNLTVLQNTEPLGVVRNFEQALAACTGEFVVLCDQDDRWHPDRVRGLLTEFADEQCLLLVHGDARLVDAAGEPLGLGLAESQRISARERAALAGGESLSVLMRRNLVTGATVALRRELLASALPIAPGWVHDEWLAIVAAAVGRTLFVEEQWVDYRQHGGNQIGVQKRGFAARFARLREPREERNARLAARARVLADRFEALALEGAVGPDAVLAAQARLAHDTVRLGLPRAYLLRLIPVLREAATGRYSRYGRGRQDVARDLLQPAR